jgi:pimeloyl-ACP methyl ester carboxylesterase
MSLGTSRVAAALLAGGALLGAAAAGGLEITDSVQAPVESCAVDLSRYFQAPPALLDCTNQSCITLCRNIPSSCPAPCTDPNCGRLVPALRDAARAGDAQEILVRSALEYHLLRHPELRPGSPLVAQALADLAVTGQASYASFRRLAPDEAGLAGPLTERLRATFPAHTPLAGEVSAALRQALGRSYQVAWALRGPTPYRIAGRDRLGWIAVSGEDDPPHRPVNVPSAPYPQYNMTVRVDGIDVVTRYMVASRHIRDDHPVYADRIPPDREHPLIIGDVVLFIHGHSSSVEEAVSLAGPLLAQAEARGRPVTLIAMDLPSNGYASMIDHTRVAPAEASSWNTGYPLLDFIENFVVAFVDGLEARQPGIKGQIVGVIGGSLGGNMALRLARRDPAVYPWLRNVVSWSPASSWSSWARVRVTLQAPCANSVFKYEAVRQTRGKMIQEETPDSLHTLFHETLLYQKIGRAGQAVHWYSESWPCRAEAIVASHRGLYEIYNARFRRWHWRVAHEQLIFSHWDSDNPSPAVDPDPRNDPAAGPARYSQIRARLLLAAGYDDDTCPEKLFSETRELARAMTMVSGSAFFVESTGHSIHAEKPAFFADRLLTFLFDSPPPPFPAFLVPAATF